MVGLSGASMFSQSLGGVSRAKYLKRLWWEERFNPRMDMKPEWAVDGRVWKLTRWGLQKAVSGGRGYFLAASPNTCSGHHGILPMVMGKRRQE